MVLSDYYSFLLRIWKVPTDGDPAWRITLENVRTREKRQFTRLDELQAYLHQATEEMRDSSDEEMP